MVSILALILGKLRGKRSIGHTSTSSPVGKATSPTPSVVSATPSPAKVTTGYQTTGNLISTVSVINNGSGYTGGIGGISYSIGSGGGGQTSAPILSGNTGFTINNHGQVLLQVTSDGNVIWSGSPSKAADIFVQSLGLRFEKTAGFTNTIRRRYLYQSYKLILKKAETMNREELLDFLREQVYNKEAKVIMDSLSDTGTEA